MEEPDSPNRPAEGQQELPPNESSHVEESPSKVEPQESEYEEIPEEEYQNMVK